jgi:hypothetical protein
LVTAREKTSKAQSRVDLSPKRSWVVIFINRNVNDLGFRNVDLPPRFFASLGFDDHLDGHGGFSFTEHASIKADYVPDIDRGYKTTSRIARVTKFLGACREAAIAPAKSM